MKPVFSVFRNKYLVASVVFLTWTVFFDRDDVLSQCEGYSEVSRLSEEKAFHVHEIEQVKKDLKALTTSLSSAEKFAREKYYMKKDNEDVFVIIREEQKD